MSVWILWGFFMFTPASSGTAHVPQGVCAWVQRLRSIALRYRQPTPKQAMQLARSLGYASGAHPNNMCGPLTAKILQEAGYFQKNVALRQFWLLNPDQDFPFLYQMFPQAFFIYRDFRGISLHRFDFRAFPLIPGDVLYLDAGKWGDFTHFLVVTHVDRQERVYSVTNVYTPAGWVVDEVLLYDPYHPKAGYFYKWTEPALREQIGGLTGTNGFLLWRPRWLALYASALARGVCASDLDYQWFPLAQASVEE